MSWIKKASNDFAFWLSPTGELTEFEYADVALNGLYHNDAIEELLPLEEKEMDQILQAENPSDELIKHGWTRGIKEGRLTYIETSSEDKVEQILGWLPFMTSKLIIDVGDEHLGLLLAEGEDFVEAWRNRNRPRVFASMGKKFWLYYDGTMEVWESPEEHTNMRDLDQPPEYSIRGAIFDDVLFLEADNERMMGWALDNLPPEYLSVKTLLFDIRHNDKDVDFEIPVLEGEDAKTAWEHRKDARHRMKVSAGEKK